MIRIRAFASPPSPWWAMRARRPASMPSFDFAATRTNTSAGRRSKPCRHSKTAASCRALAEGLADALPPFAGPRHGPSDRSTARSIGCSSRKRSPTRARGFDTTPFARLPATGLRGGKSRDADATRRSRDPAMQVRGGRGGARQTGNAASVGLLATLAQSPDTDLSGPPSPLPRARTARGSPAALVGRSGHLRCGAANRCAASSGIDRSGGGGECRLSDGDVGSRCRRRDDGRRGARRNSSSRGDRRVDIAVGVSIASRRMRDRSRSLRGRPRRVRRPGTARSAARCSARRRRRADALAERRAVARAESSFIKRLEDPCTPPRFFDLAASLALSLRVTVPDEKPTHGR